jgi:hypothetical protein
MFFRNRPDRRCDATPAGIRNPGADKQWQDGQITADWPPSIARI